MNTNSHIPRESFIHIEITRETRSEGLDLSLPLVLSLLCYFFIHLHLSHKCIDSGYILYAIIRRSFHRSQTIWQYVLSTNKPSTQFLNRNKKENTHSKKILKITIAFWTHEQLLWVTGLISFDAFWNPKQTLKWCKLPKQNLNNVWISQVFRFIIFKLQQFCF